MWSKICADKTIASRSRARIGDATIRGTSARGRYNSWRMSHHVGRGRVIEWKGTYTRLERARSGLVAIKSATK
jgi:hypothetical protein